MAAKWAFLAHIPGDPLSEYLNAALPLAPALGEADAFVLPRLTKGAAEPLLVALAAGKPALLPREALPERWSGTLGRSLSLLAGRGLVICPLTALPAWVQSGTSCRGLLTYERLRAFAAQGFDRIYLAGRPAATPLAVTAAKTRNIHLTGGERYGACQSHRLGVVYQKK